MCARAHCFSHPDALSGSSELCWKSSGSTGLRRALELVISKSKERNESAGFGLIYIIGALGVED